MKFHECPKMVANRLQMTADNVPTNLESIEFGYRTVYYSGLSRRRQMLNSDYKASSAETELGNSCHIFLLLFHPPSSKSDL